MPAVSTFKELLERYARGERDFVGSDLDVDPNNDMSRLCVDGLGLSKSSVIARVCRTSLGNARFQEADVKTCDFSNADLSGADFSRAAMCAAEFAGAQLAGAEFCGASYYSHRFKAGELPV